jgi:hypothetical protein
LFEQVLLIRVLLLDDSRAMPQLLFELQVLLFRVLLLLDDSSHMPAQGFNLQVLLLKVLPLDETRYMPC